MPRPRLDTLHDTSAIVAATSSAIHIGGRTGAGTSTVSTYARLTEQLAASVTLIVNEVPDPVGVPERRPPVDKVIPAGSVPNAIENPYGAVPPVAVIVELNGTPSVALGNVSGDNTIVGHAAPAWLTVNVSPAIVTVPLRGDVDGFAATLKLTDPLPLPLAPDSTVMNGLFETAVQAQPAVAVTVTTPDAPAAAIDAEVGAIENVHGALTVIVPVMLGWIVQ